jgi:hypothetical protein
MKEGSCGHHILCAPLPSVGKTCSIPTAYSINPSHQSVCESSSQLLLGNSSLNAFPLHRNIVGCIGLCAVRVVSKESRRLVLTEPLVTVMLLLNHFILTCAASWPCLGLIFFSNFSPTSVLPCSSRKPHIYALAQGSVLWYCRTPLHVLFDLNCSGFKTTIKHGSRLLFFFTPSQGHRACFI